MCCVLCTSKLYILIQYLLRGGGVIQRWNIISHLFQMQNATHCWYFVIVLSSYVFFFFFLDCRNSMHSGFQQESWVWDHISKSPEVLLSKDKHSAYFYIDPIYESTGTAGRHKIRIFIILCKLYISCRRHKQQCKLMQHRVVLSSLGISSVKLSAMM